MKTREWEHRNGFLEKLQINKHTDGTVDFEVDGWPYQDIPECFTASVAELEEILAFLKEDK